MASPAIEIDRATVNIGGIPIVRDFSLSVPRGSVTGILGPSGCGKTTLLRAIAGLAPLTDGTIEIDGLDQASIPTWRRSIGMVFQGTGALFPHLSVRGNVEFPFRRGLKKIDGLHWKVAVTEMLSETELLPLADRSLATLSGGQLQRVALARALVSRPSILLLDEPLTALDHELRVSLLTLLIKLKTLTGCTCVYVSHDESEIRFLATQVAVMLDGRLAQAGTLPAIWERPATARIARIIGGWNLFKVTESGLGTSSDRDEEPPVCRHQVGVPIAMTRFEVLSSDSRNGVEIPARVDHVAYSRAGVEVICRTRAGESVTALARESVGVGAKGVIVFEKAAIHEFSAPQ